MAKQQGPKETAAERAYADIGTERAGLARQMQPIKNDLFKRLSDFRQQKQRMRDQSSTDIAIAEQPVLQRARGVQSGAALPRLGLATSTADQAASTQRGTSFAHVKALGGLAGMAVGDQGAAIDGMGDLAKTSQNEAILRARKDASEAALRNETVGSAIGLAAAGAGLASGGGSGPGTGNEGVHTAYNTEGYGPAGGLIYPKR